MDAAEFSDSSYFEFTVQLKALKDALEAANILRTNNSADTNRVKSNPLNGGEHRKGTSLDFSDSFTRLLSLYQQVEGATHRILQLIYQVLKSFDENRSRELNTIITTQFAYLLVDLIFFNSLDKIIISDALLCLKLYTKILDNNEIVYRLWQRFLFNNKKKDYSEASMHVFIQFIDEFKTVVKDLNINDVEQFIYNLLLSDEREKRKAALYLMKKIYYTNGKLYTFWTSYITVLENLEENQSHLILPSLNSYKQNDMQNMVNLQMWTDALIIKILSHQNILVIRWAIEYIVEFFTCTQISLNVLMQFIKSSNNTNLYNHEGYFIPTENIQKFIKDDIARLMECMAQVNFKCVPLHFWLTRLYMCDATSGINNYQLILKIAAKIRSLQNPSIRLKSIETFEKIYHETILGMPFYEYVTLIEALYNVTDPFNYFQDFSFKLLESLNNGEKISIRQRFYEIITNNLDGTFTYIHPQLRCVQGTQFKEERSVTTQINKLNEISHFLINTKSSSNDIIWILLMIVFESRDSEVVHRVCQSFWDINLNEYSSKTFEVLSNEIIPKITSGNDTATFVRKKFADFFVKEYLTCFKDLRTYEIKAEDILAMGSHKTLLKLSQLLANNNDKVVTAVIETFLIELKRYSRVPILCYKVAKNVLSYIKQMYSSSELVNYAQQILSIDLESVGICAAVLSSGIVLDQENYIRGIIIGEANFGDARTEELYLLKLDEKQSSRLHQIRSMYIRSVPVHLTEIIIQSLLNIHKGLNSKKPRYFEYSMEHRLKLRIARAVILKLQLKIKFYEEDLLNTLLSFNNQLNINYMHEFLVAKCLPKIESILHKLDEITKYTPSQQVSLISIIHCYCILNFNTLSIDFRNIIINKFLPLTMGAHFQTRLYSQLVIYKIFDEYKANNNNETVKAEDINLQEAIALAVGPQLKELLNDARLILPHIYLNNHKEFYDVLMYITAAPAEEYLSNLDYSNYDVPKSLFSKKKSSSANKTLAPERINTFCTNWNNLQRKMNPESELINLSSLATPEMSTDFEMFVVASLVNKIPNLGGISRTCEVLGIRNLVISSRKLVEKEEFKSVSMTAEKNLNVIEVRPSDLQEFFKEKQAYGFKILGAEQTVDSVNIIGFEFPKKCVLVLGHEKEGIPSNILGFLDNTVEIPQFGLLRSLNVHVTGAMFMWEYCKQHIVKNTSATTSLEP
ncbi:uncharacterized protein [Eurosta solidaginis]|uniref:uncharacterized protein n=1 Tax=Eurosta solidaginis TaxID=178769 RepID=UPI0035305824